MVLRMVLYVLTVLIVDNIAYITVSDTAFIFI